MQEKDCQTCGEWSLFEGLIVVKTELDYDNLRVASKQADDIRPWWPIYKPSNPRLDVSVTKRIYNTISFFSTHLIIRPTRIQRLYIPTHQSAHVALTSTATGRSVFYLQPLWPITNSFHTTMRESELAMFPIHHTAAPDVVLCGKEPLYGTYDRSLLELCRYCQSIQFNEMKFITTTWIHASKFPCSKFPCIDIFLHGIGRHDS